MFYVLSILCGFMIGLGQELSALVFFLAMVLWPVSKQTADEEEDF